MVTTLREVLFVNWYTTFFITFLFFTFIYVLFCLTGFLVSKKLDRKTKITQSSYSGKQIKSEINLSIQSILIFSLQSILVQQAVSHHLVSIRWGSELLPISIEIAVLFLWNEIHFYLSHWLLHRKWFFRKIHYVHHQSTVPTPFSVYSFHWFEAFLLGSVLFFPLLSYPFHAIALVSLPLMSLALNVLGHWDYDLMSGQSATHWLKFSFRHSMHHKYVRGNYGFFLTIFDNLFKTKLNDKFS